MISTDRLLFWAYTFGIKVLFKNLQKLHYGLLGRADAENKLIELDDSLKSNPRLLRCILAEELGHIIYPPRPGHARYHSRGYWQMEDTSSIKAIVAQDERKAIDWATCVLMPNVDFGRITEDGLKTLGELAEQYEVDIWFMSYKIGYIRRKARENGQKIKWRDLIRRA